MTESKSPPSNRIPRQSILPPAALGHTYSGNQFQTPLRHKISQALQSTGVSATTPTAVSTSTSITQFHVSVPLGPSKDQLAVVTSYPPKPNSSGPPMIKAFSSLDKLTLTSPSEMRIKANVKNVDIHNVSYVKQVVGSTVKSIVTSTPSVVQATIKKDSDIGKVRPVLLSQGLRQPLKSHQIPKANVFIDPHRIIPRSTPHAQRWTGSLSEARNKAPFQNTTAAINNPPDLSTKHVVSQSPKTSINVTGAAQLPLRDTAHRPSSFPVTPLSSGNKQIYQVLTTDLQPSQGNAIKKISAMIVCQPSSISVNNSVSTSAGFVTSNNALSSGHITIMTSSDSVTYSNPLNGTNIAAIPVAKVYPQQQVSASSRIAVTSTTASRLSVPAMSSISPSINRNNPLIQVGPIKSNPTTPIILPSQPVVMSTIPVAVSSKSPANSGSILCWSSYSQTFALSTVTSSSSSRTSLTHSSGHAQTLPAPGAVRVQPPNLLLVEPKTTNLQASVGNAGQPSIQGNSPSQASRSATTPTQSPKPAILRKRPENNSALKKLTFGGGSLPAHRRDMHSKASDRRHMPYPLGRTKIGSNVNESKLDIPVAIHSDKNEIKPVLENQVFVKHHIAGVRAPLKIVGNPNAKSLASPSSNSAKDGGNHAYSVHPVLDSKYKMESLSSQKVSIKTEPASASQMLQLQNQSMHSYAAESPTVASVQHRTVSHESGHHLTTNTIFTKPVAMYPGQQHSTRTKPPHVIKAASVAQMQEGQHTFGSHAINSFTTHRMANFSSDRGIRQHDYVKKELPKLKSGYELKQLADGHAVNPAVSNHILTTSSPAKTWTSMNVSDGMVGLSPRKRPRKQTHVVSEEPVVMEDEELTDDADECEDEPMVKLAASQMSNANASAALPLRLNENKVVSVSTKTVKAEPPNKKAHLDDTRSKSKNVKAEQVPASSAAEPQAENTDGYSVWKRPVIFTRAKQSFRSVNNHFMHYSDVRAKDKKTTIADLAAVKNRVKGYNVARVARHLQDMVSCEKDVWERMKSVFDGLVEYKSAHLTDSSFDSLLGSLSPVTPSSLSNSFRKITAKNSSGSGIVENGISSQSPSTPLDRKSNKVKDDILNIEELAQANIQRCRVVCDQLSDTKTMLLKAIDHRQLVTDILDSTNNQKSTTSHLSSNQNSSKRLKKKASS